jgi:feruloyl esterase
MSRLLRQELRTVVCALLISLAPWATCSAQAAIRCTRSAIQSAALPNTTIVSAIGQSDPVAYCDVLGYVTTNHPGPNQVNFELGLPVAWNGRFLFIGNGMFAGSLAFPSVFLDLLTPFPVPAEVSAGFATVITDTGHQGTGDFPLFDGSWALNNVAKQDDWLFRGVHVVTVATKSITRSFYGTGLRSYFAGCSTGGRQALVEAQRYPADFDGIVGGDPALGDLALGLNWNEQHIAAKAENYIPPEKLALIDSAVMQSCDARDGVQDGLIEDPRKCTFNPERLSCCDENTANGLSQEQVTTLRAIYSGAATADDRQIYPGYMKTDPIGNPELAFGEDGWAFWMTGFEPPNAPGTAEPWMVPEFPPLGFFYQDQFLKYFVFSDPDYNFLNFNFNSDELKRAEAVINRGGAAGTNPHLSSFAKRGGKLILYHGWSDPAITPLATIHYYDSVIEQQGGVNPTQQFARLFMVPDMRHCIGSGGPGPNVFDPLTPLISWVERDAAPNQIIAAHFQDNDPTTGVVTRTMPLCPYPEVAKFLGGDVNDAANWSCKRTTD